jgi:hypothetical protein
MGNLWFVYEGPNPTMRGPRCQLTFSRVQELFRGYRITFLGTDTPRFASSNPSLDDYIPRYVVFELPAVEAVRQSVDRIGFQPDIREGFYQIEASIDDCNAILAAEQL